MTVNSFLQERELEANLENWKLAKKWVDSDEHILATDMSGVVPKTQGKHKGKDLQLYERWIIGKYPLIDLKYAWAVMNNNGKPLVVWTKKVAYFNGNNAIAYGRYLTKNF